MTSLPIDAILASLMETLAKSPNVVLEAPPGAGKTTKVPLALLAADWLGDQKIIMLEPRRLAARAAAGRLAYLLGEKVGATVGYRIRMESKVGPSTRIEVVTEGILTKLLQDDPSMEGVGVIVFDEFHERSIYADLGLALALDCQSGLREDLRILIMSATLDGDSLSKLLGKAPVIISEGKIFPVETKYLGKPARGELEAKTVAAIRKAWIEETGSILVFLPGEREIRRVESLLLDSKMDEQFIIAPLYGTMNQSAQDLAIEPAPNGKRKIVLSSAIAETSLTIDGIRVVIDAGLSRVASFYAPTGMTKLETVPVTKSSADQRRGRAGRLEPGVCYRLWEEAAHNGLKPYPNPEILESDLTPLALELAQWGAHNIDDLIWITPPPAKAYGHAVGLLTNLNALNANGQITPHGKAMSKLGMHPRLAHMTLRAKEMGHGILGCLIAALLTERDFLNTKGHHSDVDMRIRLEMMAGNSHKHTGGTFLNKSAFMRAKQAAENWQRHLQLSKKDMQISIQPSGILLALAYPDRIAQRRPGNQARFLLSNGSGAVLNEDDPLSSNEYLVIADLGGQGVEARIFFAAPVTIDEIRDVFADQIIKHTGIKWDKKTDSVQALAQEKLGALILSSKPVLNPDANTITSALCEGIKQKGIQSLPWHDNAKNLRQRIGCLRTYDKDHSWPDMSDEALLDGLDVWLAPYLNGLNKLSQLANLDLANILNNCLDWDSQKLLDQLAPSHIKVPSGSSIQIDYSDIEAPVLPVKLQEMFGAKDTPTIMNGNIPLTLHLLSPARKPLQITRDLTAFWANAYRHVKAEMKGRYPKHPWPDDPTSAQATAKTKRNMEKPT